MITTSGIPPFYRPVFFKSLAKEAKTRESNPTQPASQPSQWFPSLAQGRGHVRPLFAGERKIAPTTSAHDSYVKYTPENTPCPLATWHTLVTSNALNYHKKNADVLEKYIQGTGEYYQDIPWIKHAKAVGEVPYTIFDTETTGKEWDDRIIQLAASQVTEKHVVRHITDYNTYINPGIDSNGNMFEIHPGASAVHGITADQVKDKPFIEELLHAFRDSMLKQTGLVVAYNAKFDIHYLNRAIDRFNKSPLRKEHGYLRPLDPALVLDPFVLIQRIHPFVSLRKRLGDQYEILMGRPLENKHDAQADVDATVDILKYAFKSLEKHTIPKAWAEWVNKQLPEKDLAPEERAAIISRFVRENRPMLAEKMPQKAEPLLMTDILKFQHGASVWYDKSGLPKLDLALNFFGWDGSKQWIEQNDAFDAEIAQALRTERDQENRQFLYAKFLNEFTKPSIEEVTHNLQTLLATKPGKKSAQELMKLKANTLESTGKLFVDKLLDKSLPTTAKEWKSLESQVNKLLIASINDQLKGKSVPALAKRKLQERLKPLASDLTQHIQGLKQDVGERFFYTLVELDPKKPLIDPAVLAQDVTKISSRHKTKQVLPAEGFINKRPQDQSDIEEGPKEAKPEVSSTTATNPPKATTRTRKTSPAKQAQKPSPTAQKQTPKSKTIRNPKKPKS